MKHEVITATYPEEPAESGLGSQKEPKSKSRRPGRLAHLALAAVGFVGAFTASTIHEVATPEPAAATDQGDGGYPYPAAKDCPDGLGGWCNYDHEEDRWGRFQYSEYSYAYRQCTDWAAWRGTALSGVTVPGGLGSANTWDDNILGKLPTATKDYSPEVGDIIQSDSGTYGHVGIVEAVHKDAEGNITSIEVSDYNGVKSGGYDKRHYYPDANGDFWLNKTAKRKWDTFIDLNGTGAGASGEAALVGWTPPPVPWSFETLEGDPRAISPHNADVGRQPEGVVFGGKLFVFHYDASYGDLRYAYTNPNWVFDILDGAGERSSAVRGESSSHTGQTPEAVVYNNQLHVFYFDASFKDLRHAWSGDGVSWTIETLDGNSGTPGGLNANLGQTPEAIVYNGRLHVFYFDAGQGNLREGILDKDRWIRFANLDGDPGSLSGHNANVGVNPTAVVAQGALHVFSPDLTGGNLRHAWSSDGLKYRFETLDGDWGSIAGYDGQVGEHPVAVNHNGTIQLFYYNRTRGNLRHAWSDPGQPWRFEELAGDPNSVTRYDGNVGVASAATVFAGGVQLTTYDVDKGDLVHAFTSPTGWQIENLDGSGGQPAGRVNANVGIDSDLVEFGGKLHVLYNNFSGRDLRHGWAW